MLLFPSSLFVPTLVTFKHEWLTALVRFNFTAQSMLLLKHLLELFKVAIFFSWDCVEAVDGERVQYRICLKHSFI